jgi:hypothetical protein
LSADLPGLEGWAFFAVFDGHAGKMAANVSAASFLGLSAVVSSPSVLSQGSLTEHQGCVLFEVLPVRNSVLGVCDALGRAFLRHDQALGANFGSLSNVATVFFIHYFFSFFILRP